MGVRTVRSLIYDDGARTQERVFEMFDLVRVLNFFVVFLHNLFGN